MSTDSQLQTERRARRVRCIDLSPGDSVDAFFLLAGLEQRVKKNGEPYFFLTLRDSTGSVNAVMWDNHQPLVDGLIKSEDFVHAEGHTSEYNGGLQMTVRRIARVDDKDIDISEFVATSPRPREEMEKELDEYIAQVQQPDCRALLERLFGNERFREQFCTAPAAAQIHQAYVGGLLEHTLNVLRNALQLGQTYGPYDRDLLVTGGLLHDIGKIREYSWRRAITYTDEGRLVGHISIGASMVDGMIRLMQREKSSFSEHYRQHILHLILSHHGKLEYGSPVLPKTREALLLHYADYTDAYLTSYIQSVAEARNRGENWTGFSRLFDSYLYAGAPPSPADAAPAGTSSTGPAPSRLPPAAAQANGQTDIP